MIEKIEKEKKRRKIKNKKNGTYFDTEAVIEPVDFEMDEFLW